MHTCSVCTGVQKRPYASGGKALRVACQESGKGVPGSAVECGGKNDAAALGSYGGQNSSGSTKTRNNELICAVHKLLCTALPCVQHALVGQNHVLDAPLPRVINDVAAVGHAERIGGQYFSAEQVLKVSE